MKVQFFNTVDDYFKQPSSVESYSVTLEELKSACYSLGIFERKFNHKLADLLKASLECCLEEDGSLRCSDSFKVIESTFKGMASIVLGMSVTVVLARKKYQVSPLFHLRDKVLFDHSDKRFFIPGSKKIPDFFGIDAQTNAFLFEAKGCSLPKGAKTKHVPSEDMGKAVKQLQSINAVVIAHSGTVKHPNIAYSFNSHVPASGKSRNALAVGAGFEKDVLSAWVVDPIPDSSMDLIINPYQAIFDYYASFASLIEKGKLGGNRIKLDGRTYFFSESSDSLCISEEVIDFLRKSRDDHEEYGVRFRRMLSSQDRKVTDGGQRDEDPMKGAMREPFVPIAIDESDADWLLSRTSDDKNYSNPFEELKILEDEEPMGNVGPWVLRRDGIAIRKDLT